MKMNKEQQELLDEVYRKYADSHEYFVDGWLHVIPMEHSKETFINKCKTDPEFSEKWGLKIEERELKYHERRKYRANTIGTNYNQTEDDFYDLDKYNIPTKRIIITYNDKTIESYEK